MVEWFNLLNPETRGYIWQVVFEPIISLLLEKSASATLVQYVITHTFHIAEREITVTPYDFYCMIGLSFEGVIFSLGVQLGIDMLGGGGKYSIETICYFDLVSNYMFLPRSTTEECVHMARAFLLHLMGAYVFANGGKTVSLRWPTLF